MNVNWYTEVGTRPLYNTLSEVSICSVFERTLSFISKRKRWSLFLQLVCINRCFPKYLKTKHPTSLIGKNQFLQKIEKEEPLMSMPVSTLVHERDEQGGGTKADPQSNATLLPLCPSCSNLSSQAQNCFQCSRGKACRNRTYCRNPLHADKLESSTEI